LTNFKKHKCSKLLPEPDPDLAQEPDQSQHRVAITVSMKPLIVRSFFPAEIAHC